jgi:transcriptional regulator with XRE-family HTH domain
MRDARVKRGSTQQQEAEWLGISPMELNDIECGRRSMDELKKPAIEEMEYSRERGANREVKKMSLNRGSLIGHSDKILSFGICLPVDKPVTGFSIATDESFCIANQ